MVDESEKTAAPSGLYQPPRKSEVTAIEVIALVLSLIWLLATVVFFLILQPNATANSLQFMMTMLAIFLPVAMIWVAAMAARSSRVMREEGQRLNAAVEALRQSYLTQNTGGSVEPTITKKLDEIAAAQRKTESALTMFSTTRETQAARAAAENQAVKPGAIVDAEDQGLLELGTPAEDLSPPLNNADLIRALHFPETADDQEGFAALRKALKDRQASQLVQAAQDVLTLLSQDGIYMDDLRPDLARPEIWRQFAEGTRGREIAALGGVRDRSSLALTAGRMKQDPIFRDAVHHFLRRFDKSFIEFEKSATDAEISSLSETRTARAFMLVGRVSGIFD